MVDFKHQFKIRKKRPFLVSLMEAELLCKRCLFCACGVLLNVLTSVTGGKHLLCSISLFTERRLWSCSRVNSLTELNIWDQLRVAYVRVKYSQSKPAKSCAICIQHETSTPSPASCLPLHYQPSRWASACLTRRVQLRDLSLLPSTNT